MAESTQPGGGFDDRQASRNRFNIGVDWWATIVAGVFVVLAVANILPKIPW
ncbi:hypothetical protein [Mycolicibacterium sphagni]|uniref:hypothetical protein n=1 Tax=Mycolicibacterium sphagni TaxID=1786 RepID=UPI0013FD55C5|nr:hypothetical protein [Mycolicibacterium sphagni]MCV7178015.1 hypothetical protein [Mycolicibacterium sphagni]